jgi:general secretion pathway protein J
MIMIRVNTLRRPRFRGFTLIEVLIALAIFAIMAVISYRALSEVLLSRDQLLSESAALRDKALFFARFENDILALIDRPIAKSATTSDPAFVYTGNATNVLQDADVSLRFTRSGYAGTDGVAAAPQRVGYRVRGDALEWVGYAHLETAAFGPSSLPNAYPILNDVASFKLRLMDRAGLWRDRWPVASTGSTVVASFPVAIEATLTMNNGEAITRLFTLRDTLSSRVGGDLGAYQK